MPNNCVSKVQVRYFVSISPWFQQGLTGLQKTPLQSVCRGPQVFLSICRKKSVSLPVLSPSPNVRGGTPPMSGSLSIRRPCFHVSVFTCKPYSCGTSLTSVHVDIAASISPEWSDCCQTTTPDSWVWSRLMTACGPRAVLCGLHMWYISLVF